MADDEAKAAVAEAYHAYYRRLVAVVYAATGDYGGAQDAVQEAYARALDRPRQFQALDDQQAWLRVVALNFARQRWRRQGIFDRLIRLGRVARQPETVPGLSADRVDVDRALLRLPRPTREAVVLYYLLDLPVAKVADELGVPVGTVKARLARGRAALSDYLNDMPMPDATRNAPAQNRPTAVVAQPGAAAEAAVGGEL